MQTKLEKDHSTKSYNSDLNKGGKKESDIEGFSVKSPISKLNRDSNLQQFAKGAN